MDTCPVAANRHRCAFDSHAPALIHLVICSPTRPYAFGKHVGMARPFDV